MTGGMMVPFVPVFTNASSCRIALYWNVLTKRLFQNGRSTAVFEVMALALLLGGGAHLSALGPRLTPVKRLHVMQNGFSMSICLTSWSKNEPLYFRLVVHRVPQNVVPTYSPLLSTFCVVSLRGCGISTTLVGRGLVGTAGSAVQPGPDPVGQL